MRLIAYILKQLKVPFINEHLRWIFWTHPDRDNLLGYARILSYYGIETNAKKNVSLDTIDERYLPCISCLTDNKFIIIKHISSLSVVIYDGIYDKKLLRTKFVSLWNGIILQIKKTESASEPFYKKNKNNTLKKVLLFFAFSVLTLTVIIGQRLFILSTKILYNDTPCDIQLGMECANNNLTVIINLYCRSCGIEYIKVYNSLKLSQTIKTQFVIACWSKEQRDDFSILLSLRTSNYPIDKIIFDWFSYGKDFFFKHYYRKNIYKDNMIEYIISSHYKWFKNNNIKETPTCILNGRKLSSNIRILDIINTI